MSCPTSLCTGVALCWFGHSKDFLFLFVVFHGLQKKLLFSLQRSDEWMRSEVDASVWFVSSFLLDVSFATFKPLEKPERSRSGFTFTQKDSLYFMSTVSVVVRVKPC